MLQSFMIITGRSGIVLYRKILTKSVQQPRLIAGLVTALCEFSNGSIGLPAAHIQLENVTITVVEIPVDPLEPDREVLRAVLFHDTDDGDFYGHVLGMQLLTDFKAKFSERLLSMQLANVQGVEEIFKGFGAQVRQSIIASVRPVMESLESNVNVRHGFLIQHHRDGAFSKSLDSIWYSSCSAHSSTLVADVQALLAAGDDVLASQDDETSVVTVGENIRIERLEFATLVVVSAPPHTFSSCQDVITSCTRVLKKRTYSPLQTILPRAFTIIFKDETEVTQEVFTFVSLERPKRTVFILMRGLEGSRGNS